MYTYIYMSIYIYVHLCLHTYMHMYISLKGFVVLGLVENTLAFQI